MTELNPTLPPNTAPQEHGTSPSPTKPGSHVVIVGHHTENNTDLTAKLHALGCLTTHANNAQEALLTYDEQHHDLLFIHVNMPDINGYQLTQQLRATGIAIPIIGVINHPDDEAACLHAGMNAVCLQAIALHNLASLLERWPSSPIPKRYRAIFRQTMDADLAVLEQALQNNQPENAQLVLHRMAGALAVMGMQGMADRLHQIRADFSHNLCKPETDPSSPFALCIALRNLIDQA